MRWLGLFAIVAVVACGDAIVNWILISCRAGPDTLEGGPVVDAGAGGELEPAAGADVVEERADVAELEPGDTS